MALNLAELQQKADRAIHNADEFVRKWMEFIAAPAGTITLEYYDRNGNLRTVSFSNRNKLVQDFIANVNNVMAKIIYVNQLNGNDANDGSQTAPFQSIPKAVNSTPAGGKVYIIVVGDYDLTGEIVVIDNDKKVTLELRGNLTVSWTTTSSGDSALAGKFEVRGGHLRILIDSDNNGKITIPDDNTGATAAAYPEFIRVTGLGSDQPISSVAIDIFTRIDNYTPIYVGNRAELIALSRYWNFGVFAMVGVRGYFSGVGREVTIHSGATLLRLGYDSSAAISLDYRGGWKDELGNAIDPKTKVVGIVYDATATTVPINILSKADF